MRRALRGLLGAVLSVSMIIGTGLSAAAISGSSYAGSGESDGTFVSESNKLAYDDTTWQNDFSYDLDSVC